MASLRSPNPVALFIGVISGFPEAVEVVRTEAEHRFGVVQDELGPVPFDFTDYYTGQMGADLKRWFYAFEPGFDPAQIVDAKRWAVDLETRLAQQGYPVPRPVNVDPGYVDLGKLVLSSAKNYTHRIYLGRGVYAEVTLGFTDGAFRPYPWTYRDYRTEAYLHFFRRTRDRLYRLRRSGHEEWSGPSGQGP